MARCGRKEKATRDEDSKDKTGNAKPQRNSPEMAEGRKHALFDLLLLSFLLFSARQARRRVNSCAGNSECMQTESWLRDTFATGERSKRSKQKSMYSRTRPRPRTRRLEGTVEACRKPVTVRVLFRGTQARERGREMLSSLLAGRWRSVDDVAACPVTVATTVQLKQWVGCDQSRAKRVAAGTSAGSLGAREAIGTQKTDWRCGSSSPLGSTADAVRGLARTPLSNARTLL